MTEIICSAQDVHKSFGSHHVLQGINLQIPKGAVVGLIGTNGAGKSTFLHCALGLMKPESGSISIMGEEAWNISGKVKAKLGFVPQTVQLYPWMTARQIIGYTASFYPNWDHQWVEKLTTVWSIPMDKRVGPLSQGQLQKLAIVLALGHKPDLLILDEPVASLDPLARREFLKALLELLGDNNEHTILFSTHITSDLERVASHLAVLKDGKISIFDELDKVKDQVKRVRLIGTNEFSPNETFAGSLHTRIEGNVALISVMQVNEDLLQTWRTTHHATTTIEDLSLEEIFLELHDAKA